MSSSGVSALIAAAFIGVWLMTTSVQSGLTERIGRLEAVPIPRGDLELQERTEKLNALTGTVGRFGGAVAEMVGFSERVEKKLHRRESA